MSDDFFFYSEIQIQGFRNESEREFLTALFAHSFEWAQLGVTDQYCMINYQDSILMIAFDICDWNGNVVLRSLRVDFDCTSVLMGETGSNLFDIKFDAAFPGIVEFHKAGASPADAAEAAAKWLYCEMSRPIVLKEWITRSFHHKQYELSDNNQPLSWSDSQNKKRSSLGSPTRAAIIHPKNSRKTFFT